MLQRVCYRLEPIVCAELAIDAAEVVAQRSSRSAQLACDRRGVDAFREELDDAAFVTDQRLDRRVLGQVIGKRNELSRGLQRAIDECGVEPALQALHVLDQVVLSLRGQIQLEEGVVMIHQVHQRGEPAVSAISTLLVRPESGERSGPIHVRGGAVCLKASMPISRGSCRLFPGSVKSGGT